MRTIKIKLYKFEELSESAQEKTINALYDINVDYDWYEDVHYGARRVGVDIQGYDIGRRNSIDIEFKENHEDVAEAIIDEYGEKSVTDLCKLSGVFIKELSVLLKKIEELDSVYIDYDVTIEELDDDIEFLKKEYEDNIGECYLSILRSEYECRTSEEAIRDSIIANEYEFTEDGGDIY